MSNGHHTGKESYGNTIMMIGPSSEHKGYSRGPNMVLRQALKSPNTREFGQSVPLHCVKTCLDTSGSHHLSSQ